MMKPVSEVTMKVIFETFITPVAYPIRIGTCKTAIIKPKFFLNKELAIAW